MDNNTAKLIAKDLTAEIDTKPEPRDLADQPNRDYDPARLEAISTETDRLETIIDDHFDTLDYAPSDDPDDVYDSYCELPDTIIGHALNQNTLQATITIAMRGRPPRTHVTVDDPFIDPDIHFTYGGPEAELIHAELMYCTIRGGVVVLASVVGDETLIRGWDFDPDFAYQMTAEQLDALQGPAEPGCVHVGQEHDQS